MQRPVRLPFWPLANGLALTALDLVGLRDAAADAEAAIGGRVAPMSLGGEDADPFVLLVHHRHRFSAWDPLRPLLRLLIPEGFPAHPHRGFETVTMTIDGGLTHRDSLGVQQRYGDGEVQWLTAARGVLHEEMWWANDDGRAELYQLWLNLPAAAKMVPPRIQLFVPPAVKAAAGDDGAEGGVRVHVLGGEYASVRAPVELAGAPVTLLRVEIPPGGEWVCPLPASRNCIVYVRTGALEAGAEAAPTSLPAHHLAYLPARAAVGTDGVRLVNADRSPRGKPAEALVLAGEPLREPVAGGGTWVMNTQAELDQADRDYAAGVMGVPWEHTATDDEWRAHVARARGAGAGGGAAPR
ncbi:hypothetical protein KFE25_009554 [Diacronema lutheri]|uniref:Pirin n=1 Tax=Diacronema lutheri TaxID=2081491 RepID=A0A8J5XSZ4_DIALT|nr:hypothetical protein KFE25_009554 [Diacronema lutheri]